MTVAKRNHHARHAAFYFYNVQRKPFDCFLFQKANEIYLSHEKTSLSGQKELAYTMPLRE